MAADASTEYASKVAPEELLKTRVGFPKELMNSPLVMHRELTFDTFHVLMKERSNVMWNVEKDEKTIKPEQSTRGHRGTVGHQGFFFQQVEKGKANPPFEGFTRWDQFQAIWVHLSELNLNDFAPDDSGKGDFDTVRHTYEAPERWEALQFATNDFMGRVDVLEHFKEEKLFVVHVVNKKLPSVGFVDFCLAVKAVLVSETEWYCVTCSVTHPKCPERPGMKRVTQLGSVLWIKDQNVQYTLALKDQRVSGCLVRCMGGTQKVDEILLRQYWEGQEEAFQRMAAFDIHEHQRELDEAEKDKRKKDKKAKQKALQRKSSFGMGTQMAVQIK